MSPTGPLPGRDVDREIEGLRADLSSLVHTVSHDLRAPLRAVDGFSRLLVEEHADEMSDHALAYVTRIQDNAMLMSDLIGGLLALYRVQPESVSAATVDMTSLAHAAWHHLVEEHDGYHLTVAVLPDAVGDAVLLRQVWENLLANAVKFSRGRSDVIEVGSASGGRQDGPERSYWVRDHGVGFDVDHAADIFTIFRRAHGPREFAGRGVGLAMVRRIVEIHGGRVWAESAPDAGATFHFTLPAAAS